MTEPDRQGNDKSKQATFTNHVRSLNRNLSQFLLDKEHTEKLGHEIKKIAHITFDRSRQRTTGSFFSWPLITKSV